MHRTYNDMHRLWFSMNGIPQDVTELILRDLEELLIRHQDSALKALVWPLNVKGNSALSKCRINKQMF